MSSTKEMQSLSPVRDSDLMRKSPKNQKTGSKDDGLVNLAISRPIEFYWSYPYNSEAEVGFEVGYGDPVLIVAQGRNILRKVSHGSVILLI